VHPGSHAQDAHRRDFGAENLAQAHQKLKEELGIDQIEGGLWTRLHRHA
jgi:hypothetical protein